MNIPIRCNDKKTIKTRINQTRSFYLSAQSTRESVIYDIIMVMTCER